MRISFRGIEDDIATLLDTGFNGPLLIAAADCARLGVMLHPLRSTAMMADGRREEAQRGECTIAWLGQTRQVEVLKSGAAIETRKPDDPEALVGTGLLTPHALLIDFGAGTVEVESQD